MYKYCWIYPGSVPSTPCAGVDRDRGRRRNSLKMGGGGGGEGTELGEIQIIAIFAILLKRIYKKLGTTDLSRRCPGDWALGYN